MRSAPTLTILLKVFLGLWAMMVASFLIIFILVFGRIYGYIQVFLTESQLSLPMAFSLVQTGLRQPLLLPDHRYTILILGTDYLYTRGDAPILTDTIMLSSLNVTSGKVALISFPRDIWLPSAGQKLNAFYQQGIREGSPQPESRTQAALEELTAVPIHRTVVVSLEQVASMIDLLGGITLDVPEGFTDPLFPVADVDVTQEKDPQKLYKTVEFQPGLQVMSGQRALEYVRSRHSAGSQGNDLARNSRQQQVFSALMSALQNKSLWLDPVKMGRLYHFYQRNWSSSLPPTELIALAKLMNKNTSQLQFSAVTFSEYPYDPAGQLIHPPLARTAGQWAYLIRDSASFKAYVASLLP